MTSHVHYGCFSTLIRETYCFRIFCFKNQQFVRDEGSRIPSQHPHCLHFIVLFKYSAYMLISLPRGKCSELWKFFPFHCKYAHTLFWYLGIVFSTPRIRSCYLDLRYGYSFSITNTILRVSLSGFHYPITLSTSETNCVYSLWRRINVTC